MDERSLPLQIEQKRKQLNALAESYADLLHPDVIRASTELDELIVKYMQDREGRR